METRLNPKPLAREIWLWFTAAPPSEDIFDWAIREITFDEPAVKGPFDPTGREYLREPLQNFTAEDCSDQTLCLATGLGKTLISMIGTAWRMAYPKTHCLRVMPAKEGKGGGRDYMKNRFIKMCRASAIFAAKWPRDRHAIKGLEMVLDGNNIGISGSNTPAQVASNRCDLVDQDETDKFKRYHGRRGDEIEAGTFYLANERTKGVPNAFRNRSSSPSTADGIIWTDLLASDIRRRFLPCPRCNPSAEISNQVSVVSSTLSDRALEILKRYNCESQLTEVLKWLEI